MFTINRNGVLALCMVALLTQNAQMQAWSFTDLYNSAKNNPKTTAAVMVGAMVVGYGLYKWLFQPKAFTLVPYANYSVRSYADLHKEHTFALGDAENGQYWVLVGMKAQSQGLFQQVDVESATFFTMSYADLVSYFRDTYNIDRQQLDQMIEFSRSGPQQIDQQQARAMIQYSTDHS